MMNITVNSYDDFTIDIPEYVELYIQGEVSDEYDSVGFQLFTKGGFSMNIDIGLDDVDNSPMIKSIEKIGEEYIIEVYSMNKPDLLEYTLTAFEGSELFIKIKDQLLKWFPNLEFE